jgi:hypothetical protein
MMHNVFVQEFHVLFMMRFLRKEKLFYEIVAYSFRIFTTKYELARVRLQ